VKYFQGLVVALFRLLHKCRRGQHSDDANHV
jgi:hypothetical protein